MMFPRLVTSAIVALLAAACTASAPEPAAPSPAGPGAASPAAPELKPASPSADYPLKVCLVTGDELGSMGAPKAYTWGGREVQFCCDGCVGDFRKDPAKYLARLDAAK